MPFDEFQDIVDEDGLAHADEAGEEISDAEVEKLIKALEHGSSRNTSRGGATRRGEMDEVRVSGIPTAGVTPRTER